MKERMPCKRCGGEKPAGHGRRLCDECQKVPRPEQLVCGCGGPKDASARECDACIEAREWRTPRRRAARAAMARKPCMGCGRPKGPRAFRYCSACQRKRERERLLCRRCRKRPRIDPNTSSYCEVCRAEGQALARAGRAATMRKLRRENEERAERMREANRQWRARQAKVRPSRTEISGWIDDSAALAAAIRRAAAKSGEPTLTFCESLHHIGDTHFDSKGHKRTTTAASIDRSLRRWEAGERVQFDVADRMLTRLGLLWFDVWPDDVQVRRLFEGDEDQWREAA